MKEVKELPEPYQRTLFDRLISKLPGEFREPVTFKVSIINESESVFTHWPDLSASRNPGLGRRGRARGGVETDLDFNLSLRNILLATASAGNPLRLGELSTYRLRAKVLQGEGFDGVDTQLGVWLDDRKAAGYCISHNAFVNGGGGLVGLPLGVY